MDVHTSYQIAERGQGATGVRMRSGDAESRRGRGQEEEERALRWRDGGDWEAATTRKANLRKKTSESFIARVQRIPRP